MSANPVDPALVKALADILAGADLTEIEVERDNLRIRVARTPAPVTVTAAPAALPAPAAAPAPAASPATPAAPAEDVPAEGTVPSPMVGVAYLAPEPGAAPYVTIGQQVSAGQTLLLIEAMKTFNQIRATRAGTVMRILVTSGQPVEFGQPLLVIA